MIRAARLGWGHSPKHGCFVRMSDAEGKNSRIELCPSRSVPSKKSANRYHRCWWEGDSDVLEMIPWLKGVRAIKKYVCVVVDDEGQIVRSEV